MANGELDAEIAGQKISLKNVSLNTLATVATLLIVSLIAVFGYSFAQTHTSDTKESARELVQAMKEQTQAQREGNCLQGYQGPAQEKATFCKQVTR